MRRLWPTRCAKRTWSYPFAHRTRRSMLRATAEQIGAIVGASGASFVDGGIIGAPVQKAGTTRLYLSGSRASEVAALFSGSMLDARAIGAAPGAASALKVAYAAWTKCTDALVLAIRALATHEGVDQALLEEWSISQRNARDRRGVRGRRPADGLSSRGR